ncbi:unnamed protein product [Orchesella dallaii]|uniref:Uncharacterized protein n=1 Tax=Orchesella dallaii TaxID=48710 RepID=A0ABP1QT07_9HEXA
MGGRQSTNEKNEDDCEEYSDGYDEESDEDDYEECDGESMNEVDTKTRLDDNLHQQEILKIQCTEKENQRMNNLALKETEFEHIRLMDCQDRMHVILKDTFSKVQNVTAPEAALSACVLQSVQAGKPVDKDVLLAVTSKLPAPPPAGIDRIVDRIMEMQSDEEEDEESFTDHGTSLTIVT